ncbi:response regulator [Loktanella sp. M215]|uniref:response regulator n=1 Tax=Loktanella sp. M215 TaxID=2675431 RepID=UPI001F015D89|nr:response regulator [Loktanella sp. M215]MCF7701601.1 response regulator [Loktanella sp. M215]
MTGETKLLPAVLVVEDEPLIRMEAVDMIEDAGFRVYDVGSADAAVVLLERHDDIGILFTDINMPGSMDGLQLATCVKDRWPSVGIVIASGIIDYKEMELPKGASIFPKPYPTDKIAKALSDIVAGIA